MGGEGWGKKFPLPKLFQRCPTMMKLAFISCLKKIKKVYESPHTPPAFCWHQRSFSENEQVLLYHGVIILNDNIKSMVLSRNTDMDCILIHNF